PREYYPREPSFLTPRGQHRPAAMARRVRSRRGRRTRHRHIRVPQELGTPCSLHELLPGGEPDDQAPAHGLRVRDPCERTTDAPRGIATRSTTKRGETEAGNRSASYYRGSRRTQPAGIRWREGGAGLRNRWREAWPVRRNRTPCSRNNNG